MKLNSHFLFHALITNIMPFPIEKVAQGRRWRASAAAEQKKLLSSPSSKLAGDGSPLTSRTRGTSRGRERRPFSRLASPANLFGSSDSVLTTPSALTLSSVSSPKPASKKKVKPPESRVLLETNAIKSMMERHIVCPRCTQSVVVSFPTKCIATTLRIDCSDKTCGFVDLEKPMAASPPLPDDAGSARIIRNSDSAINILFVLAFLTKGDGGSEAAHLLGLLGLPNSTTFDGSSFGAVEQQIGRSVLQKLADEVVYERNLVEEVRLFYKEAKYNEGDATDEREGCLMVDLWKDNKLDDKVHLWPALTFSADMGWQGRSSGMQFNSLSGDALLVGSLTRKPCAWYVLSRNCSYCKGWKRGKRKADPVPAHDCRKNWDGSAGAMEPVAILEMTKLLYDGFMVVTSSIVTDDDSSIKTKLKWSNEDTMTNKNLDEPPFILDDKGKKKVRPDKGELPIYMPEPTYVADPNHRKKSFGGELYRYESLNVDKKDGITRMDILRLTQNFCYMVRSLQSTPRSQWQDCAKCVVEHHFDNHHYCGLWCWRKKQTAEEQEKEKKMYRCKTKNYKLYLGLTERIARFITEDALDEVGHGMDTLVNESFNNTAAWVAPKNKVYSSSESLKNRIGVCLGINGLGTHEYYKLLFQRLGIEMATDVEHYIKVISNKRHTRITKGKTPKAKLKRQAKYQSKLLAKTVIAKREKAKKEGSYKRGMGITNDGYTEDELAKAKLLFPGDYKQPKGPQKAAKTCAFCGKKGHATNRSKKCPEHAAWLASKATATAPVNQKQPPPTADADVAVDSEEKQLERDGAECNLMDQLPLEDNDDSEDDDFFDAYDNMDWEQESQLV